MEAGQTRAARALRPEQRRRTGHERMAAGAPVRQARGGEEEARSARTAGYPPDRPAARRQTIPDQQPHAGKIIAPLPVLELGACGDFLRRAKRNRLVAASRRLLKSQKKGAG